jgi:hypothetical protein
VIVRVDGARGREALGRLIDTGGLTIVEGEQATADRARERNRAAKTAASQAEWLDVAGTPQAIAALLAALTDATDAAGYGLATGGIGPSLPPTAPQAGVGGDSGSVAGAGLDAVAGPGQTLERLVLVVVERPAPADHTTEPAP